MNETDATRVPASVFRTAGTRLEPSVTVGAYCGVPIFHRQFVGHVLIAPASSPNVNVSYVHDGFDCPPKLPVFEFVAMSSPWLMIGCSTWIVSPATRPSFAYVVRFARYSSVALSPDESDDSICDVFDAEAETRPTGGVLSTAADRSMPEPPAPPTQLPSCE